MPTHLHRGLHSARDSPDNELAIKLVVAGESRERAIDLVRKMEDSQHFQQTQIMQENRRPAHPGRQCKVQYQRALRPGIGDAVRTTTAKRSAR